MRGRKPNLHVLPGGRNRKPGERACTPATASRGCCPVLPKLLVTPLARAEWKRLAATLWADGRLNETTRSAFASYCLTFGRWAAIEQEIARLQHEAGSEAAAWMVMKPSGITQATPLMKLARELSMDLLKFSAELGLTPVSQQRVKLNHTPDPTSPAAEFFSRGAS